MAPYSMDLRERVARAWDATGDAEEVAGHSGSAARGCIGWCNAGEKRAPSHRGRKPNFGRACWRARSTAWPR
jgi:hypothetical protein